MSVNVEFFAMMTLNSAVQSIQTQRPMDTDTVEQSETQGQNMTETLKVNLFASLFVSCRTEMLSVAIEIDGVYCLDVYDPL